MKIKFSQTGGFAGLTRGCELDTQSLPTDEAAKLQSLVEESGILQSQSSNSNTSNARDAFNYNITIETNDGDEQTISYDDLNQPENTPKSTRENGSP
ncbi:MAG: hypothetical protein MJK14_12255, partial [Rivularia sp. ALOHA_DT_140]|nr:hypothetical protein [Rivularia sp. ALOHA_DT_140]